MADEVRTERDGPVLVVTLNRPEVRNAVNGAAARAVAAAVDVLDEDPELVVGILTGAGGTFSSGMDLKAFLTGDVPLIEGRGARRRPRARRAHRGQRPARRAGDEADRGRGAGPARRGAMGPAGRAARAGVHIGGRAGGGEGVRRETRPRLARRVRRGGRSGREYR